MPTNSELNQAARDYISAFRVRRRAEIQAEMDSLRDFRVAEMNAQVDALKAQFDAVQAIANGTLTADEAVNPPDDSNSGV